MGAAGLLVGLYRHACGCLAWGFPGLVLTSQCVGPGPGSNKLEERLKNIVFQHQSPYGKMSSPINLPLVSVSPG